MSFHEGEKIPNEGKRINQADRQIDRNTLRYILKDIDINRLRKKDRDINMKRPR